jgi:putative membrane protein
MTQLFRFTPHETCQAMSRKPDELGPRWARRLLSVGVDPDPRFSLANERTFLAWIRTSLGMIALGVGIATFVSTQASRGFSILVAAGLVVLGGVIGALSWFRWLNVERAMRQGHGIPPSRSALYLALGVSALALLSIAVILTAT